LIFEKIKKLLVFEGRAVV